MKILMQAITLILYVFLLFALLILANASIFISSYFFLLFLLFLVAISIVCIFLFKNNKSYLISNIRLFCTLPVLSFLVLIFDPLPMGSYLMKFDADTWKTEQVGYSNIATKRKMMLGSLYWYHLNNKTEHAIIDILGESTQTYRYKNNPYADGNLLSYKIGSEDSLLDPESIWLILYFDKHGTLIKKKIDFS